MDARFPIVGVGASAGGVEALEGLFRAMPPAPGMAFVIVTHQSPRRESMLPGILARAAQMPVRVVDGAQAIHANHIYVASSDGNLEIRNARLTIHANEDDRERAPIDAFFAMLAEDQNEYAIGIVLSGGGHDGTLGIKAIKEHGGLTLAQVADGSGPQHSSMPDSAIGSGLVDLAVPVAAMPEKLLAYLQSFGLLHKVVAKDSDVEAIRKSICATLLDHTGHDFSDYKTKTFDRRLERRMQVLQITSLEAYAKRLRDDAGEVTTLFRDLLIGVTNFFRDANAFEALEKQAIPRLFENKGAQDTVRVWVPGCATGEEVYSLAILLREQAERVRSRVKMQLFATDIDEAALAVARSGRYPKTLLDGVSKERLGRFFTAEGSSYLISKQVRDMCVFSSHSVVRDPPFSRMHLISCRNLLIYLNSELQGRVIPVFHYALRPNGFLFLGTSENITQQSDLFIPIDKKNRLFQRRSDGASRFPLPPLFKRAGGSASRGEASREPMQHPIRELIEARVLERYVPPHVVTTREGDIVYFSSGTGKYLEAPPGRPSRSLAAMARKGLRLPLRSALQEAADKERTAVREGVSVEFEHHSELAKITVEPMREDGSETLYLVVFNDLGAVAANEAPAAKRRGRRERDPGVDQTESELRDTRERLQSMAEEYETAIEELKSSNEEMVSVNEELQSANEELETSKEELQSVNEELQTVNQELTLKIDELDHANSDLKNLYDATDIATVFLDRDLVIRNFTPAVARIFNLLPSDQGRPLTDIVHHLDYVELADDIARIFETQQTFERRVRRHDGSAHYIMRALPYWTGQGRVEGAILTFIEVTGLARAEEHQRTLVAELNHRVRNMLTVIVGLASLTLRGATSPETFAKTFVDRLHAMARSYDLIARDQWNDVSFPELVRETMAPYLIENEKRVVLEGPAVSLKPKMALSLGMVIHELATNAVKYGCLAEPTGSLAIRWRVERRSRTCLMVDWKETAGPDVKDTGRRGFGLNLIEREIRNNLGGEIRMDFQPDGLRVNLEISLDSL
jgi:two-component system CheB/CheR fusion protein